MSAKKIVAKGFLSMIAAATLFVASNGLAAEPQRVDVIDSLLNEGVQLDSRKHTSDKSMRVDVIDRIGSDGAVYPSTSGSMRVDVIDRVRV